MTQKQIQQAIDGGAKFVDENNIYRIYNCEHEWISVGNGQIVCEKCCIDMRNI